MTLSTPECLRTSTFEIEASIVHLRHLKAHLEMTSGLIHRTRTLIAAAKPPEVPKGVQAGDDYEAKLLFTARIVEILSAAGYSCKLLHGVNLH